ncbi:hypothetical protein Tco_0231212 [Tanacetum coccineum]
MDTLWSVRELCLSRVTLDDAFTDMIKSKFPFLETLTLAIDKCMLQTCEITSVSLKRLTLCLYVNEHINIQVYASKLHYFSYDGRKMPSLLFPSKTPAHIKLILRFSKSCPVDVSYFLKVREALDLSSNFDIETIYDFVPLDIDLDDLRRMVPFPARNVQQLSFGKYCERKLWNHSPLFDFLFAICHPCYVKTYYRTSNDKNYLYKQMVEMKEKKAHDLKDIEIRNPHDGKWESLTSSWRNDFLFDLPWRSFYDKGNDYNADEFRLNWWS